MTTDLRYDLSLFSVRSFVFIALCIAVRCYIHCLELIICIHTLAIVGTNCG
jgi:hypothetical protein